MESNAITCPNERKTNNRIIQACRGVAIIGVLLNHNSSVSLFTVLFSPLFTFAVPVFLVLSGYLTKLPISKSTMWKRIKKVLIPYCIWSLIYTLFSGSWDTFAYDFLTFQCCSPFYYIAVYIQFVLLTPLIEKLLVKKYWKIGFLISPISMLVEYIAAWSGNPIKFPFNAILFFQWFSFYYLGICIKNRNIDISRVPMYIAVGGGGILSLILQAAEGYLWYLFGSFEIAAGMKMTWIITSMIIGVIMIKCSKDNEVQSKECWITHLLGKIGDNSFAIYLSHIFVMSVLNHTVYNIIQPHWLIKTLIVLVVEMIGLEILKEICHGKYEKQRMWLGLD